ncbi:MAG: UPF0164 family protein, partial [Spirochaetota bacterium]
MRRVQFIIIVMFLMSASIQGSDFSEIYGDASESAGKLDPDAGLTIFPLLLIPTGGKYEGMGTAFTAVADDTGFLEANPS